MYERPPGAAAFTAVPSAEPLEGGGRPACGSGGASATARPGTARSGLPPASPRRGANPLAVARRTARVRARPVPPFPPVLGAAGRRSGRAIVVSWRTPFAARRVTFAMRAKPARNREFRSDADMAIDDVKRQRADALRRSPARRSTLRGCGGSSYGRSPATRRTAPPGADSRQRLSTTVIGAGRARRTGRCGRSCRGSPRRPGRWPRSGRRSRCAAGSAGASGGVCRRRSRR